MRQAGIWDARRVARALVTRLGISAPEHIRMRDRATVLEVVPPRLPSTISVR